MFHPYFEQLAAWATGPRFQEEVTAARTAFFGATGPIYDDDRSFELRMGALSEYYLLDRPLEDDPTHRTPARLFLDEQFDSLDADGRGVIRGLTRSHPSLFEIRKLGETSVVVRDLLLHEEHAVDERRRLPGLAKGDVVQARLVPWQDQLIFSRAVLFHPREARKPILKAVKRRRKAGELDTAEERQDFLWQLARRALMVERQQANNRNPPTADLAYQDL